MISGKFWILSHVALRALERNCGPVPLFPNMGEESGALGVFSKIKLLVQEPPFIMNASMGRDDPRVVSSYVRIQRC